MSSVCPYVFKCSSIESICMCRLLLGPNVVHCVQNWVGTFHPFKNRNPISPLNHCIFDRYIYHLCNMCHFSFKWISNSILNHFLAFRAQLTYKIIRMINYAHLTFIQHQVAPNPPPTNHSQFRFTCYELQYSWQFGCCYSFRCYLERLSLTHCQYNKHAYRLYCP